MNQHEEKINLLKKYYKQIKTNNSFYIASGIPYSKLNNALESFALELDMSEILGFYDITTSGTGKNGYIFSDTAIYYIELSEKPEQIYYNKIKNIELPGTYEKNYNNGIKFTMDNNQVILLKSFFLNKIPLFNFLQEMLVIINKQQEADKNIFNISGSISVFSEMTGAMSGGNSASRYGTVNKLYDEEKFHARQGHGFAAERANNLFDKLTGHDAHIIGDDNQKNGADRILDGNYIQSKYCGTGPRCVNECFENNGHGSFRYMHKGKPMQIEVPSDKYEAAVEAMKVKIEHGQVPGVENPEEAINIIKKGHFTYEQAKNIAKAGTIESLAYDSVNGIITATSSFGITALITFATSVWNGEDFNYALKTAAYSGLKVGGTAFLTSIIASQLSKAGLNSALVGSSEAIIGLMGPKASAVLVNAFRNGSNIYGAAAMKSAAKLLRGNIITAGITMVILSSSDFVNIFRGRISGKQMFKNLTNTAAGLAGGTGGFLAGAAAGSAIFPGAGTLIGGLIGSVAAGAATSKVSSVVLDTFLEDDAEEMTRIIESMFTSLAFDYLLNQEEAEKIVINLQEELDGKKLQDMFASNDHELFARNLLLPLIEDITSKREKIYIPDNKEMTNVIKEILENASDNSLMELI
ncbi:MAG: hypothetical protein HFH68_07280 [Lachnospiraceae bacterium]|nr:hypothetical protein [Lachnospiraceae bacterium]